MRPPVAMSLARTRNYPRIRKHCQRKPAPASCRGFNRQKIIQPITSKWWNNSTNHIADTTSVIRNHAVNVMINAYYKSLSSGRTATLPTSTSISFSSCLCETPLRNNIGQAVKPETCGENIMRVIQVIVSAIIFAVTILLLIIIETLVFNYISDWQLTGGRLELLANGRHIERWLLTQ